MKKFVPKNQGPAVIRSMSSNTLSDAYRDAVTIAYQFIGSTVADTAWNFCGRTLSAPVMAGPIGLHGDKMPEDADVLYARAVAEAGSVYWAHYHSPENWAKTLAEGIPAIRVIKPLRDLDAFLDEVRFDTEHGAIGYAMDIDHGITVYGEMDGQQKPFGPKTVDDLRRISEASPLPFFIKGVMTAHDALLAREAGAAGVVISGHNNRFPCAVPPLKALPGIRAAVGNDFVLLVDGGMNTGYDVFKALALGADGVLCARTLCAAFAKDGADGLTDRLLEIGAELRGAMGNTGSPDLQHISRNSVILP